jgi:phosphoribosylformylglycinamidine cyclo-ligase
MKYSDSGVNIDAAQKALASAKSAVKSTWNDSVLGDLGSFGGLYRTAPGQPLLVASVDGVGTKVKIAVSANRFNTVGQDLVNHCVNDILVQGALPLFFLDYFATGCLTDGMLEDVLDGFAKACRENHCALLGGETAEMPGVYIEGEFDLAGCIVGQVKEEDLVDGSKIKSGDIAWGLASTGLHTNGYSLARSALLDSGKFALSDIADGMDVTIMDSLLAVHKSYLMEVKSIWKTFGKSSINGMVHITGGGFYDNIPRVIPEGKSLLVDTSKWEVPPIFNLIAECGEVAAEEMYRVFNMGIGMVLIMPDGMDPNSIDGIEAIQIGHISDGDNKVIVDI